MNKEKTGGLIAAVRKEKGLTQEQLGEILHVTGKAVSKWERGAAAPGIDLLEPLAAALDVTVTELLAGQRVEREHLNQKAQQLALELLRREKRAFCRTVAWCGALCLLLVVFVMELWGPAIFQRGNPVPYLLAAARLSEARPYVPVDDGPGEVYITRRGACPALLALVEERRGVRFVEQAGSGWLFTSGADALWVTSEVYWGRFTVWEVPDHTLQGP